MSLLLIAALVSPGGLGSSVHLDVAKIVLEKLIADASPGLVRCIDINSSDPLGELLDQCRGPVGPSWVVTSVIERPMEELTPVATVRRAAPRTFTLFQTPFRSHRRS